MEWISINFLITIFNRVNGVACVLSSEHRAKLNKSHPNRRHRLSIFRMEFNRNGVERQRKNNLHNFIGKYSRPLNMNVLPCWAFKCFKRIFSRSGTSRQMVEIQISCRISEHQRISVKESAFNHDCRHSQEDNNAQEIHSVSNTKSNACLYEELVSHPMHS